MDPHEAALKHIFLDSDRHLRNGWWVLVFLGLFAASRLVYGPVTRGLKELGLAASVLELAPFIFVLLVTWACVRLRKERLSSIGFRLDRRWLKEAGWGTLLGVGSALAAVAMMWAAGGVRLELDPARSLGMLGQGLYLFACVSLFEETLFRGFVFQRLVDGAGVWVAQVSLALLFAASHWGNPDMHGATMAWATIEIFLGAVLLGLAYLRTGSLALPVGLHLGWNWGQAHILGFGASGFDHVGWFRPVLQDRADWLTGGSFGLESTVFAVLTDLIVIALLWRWKGSRATSVTPSPRRSDRQATVTELAPGS